MFGLIDHLIGAINVRMSRFFLRLIDRPDLSYVGDKLTIGGHCNIKTLWKNDVKAVVDLRMEAEDDREALKKYHIEYLHISILDRNVPQATDVYHVMDWIESKLNSGFKVFIHCNLGRGRAPLIACAYLIIKGVSKENAIKKIKEKRKVTYFNQRQLSWLDELKNN